MNPGPDHEAVQEMLAAAALGTLTDAELQRVVTHTRDCPECALALQEYREAAANLTLILPTKPLDPARSARTKSRLMARVRLEERGRITHPQPDRWVGWLVAAGLAGILLMHHSVHRPLDYGWLAAGVLVLLTLGLGIYASIQRKRVADLESRVGDAGAKRTHDAQGSPNTQGGPPGGYNSVRSRE